MYFKPSITYYVTGISLICITVHSRSNHHEFNHSCHWLISQFNHLNHTKVSHLKISGEAAWPLTQTTPRWHMDLGIYGASNLNSFHWEFLAPPLLALAGRARRIHDRLAGYAPVPTAQSLHISHCIHHHLGLTMPVTNLYINWGAPPHIAHSTIAPFGSTGVTSCISLFPGTREWRLHIPDSREWKNRPGNANPNFIPILLMHNHLTLLLIQSYSMVVFFVYSTVNALSLMHHHITLTSERMPLKLNKLQNVQ